MVVDKGLVKKFLAHNFPYKVTSTGEIRINSIYDKDVKFHLYISPELNKFYCFKTGESGGITKLITDYLGINKEDVYEYLLSHFSEGKDLIIPEIKNSVFEIPPINFFYSSVKDKAYKQAAIYLVDRGISKEKIMKLGFVNNDKSSYNNRIIVPFYENGEIVYFIARDFVGSKLRYMNPAGVNSKQFLFNKDEIENTVCICEGVFDAMSFDEQVGTAMIGAELSKQQAVKIWQSAPENIIYVPDNDETGMKNIDNNINTLYNNKIPFVESNLYIYFVDEKYKDFNEYKVHTGIGKIKLEDCIPIEKYYKDKFFEKCFNMIKAGRLFNGTR
jgi:DNA primase